MALSFWEGFTTYTPIHSGCFCFLLISHAPVNGSCILYGLPGQHSLYINEDSGPIYIIEQGEVYFRLLLSKHTVGHGENDCIVLGLIGFVGFVGFMGLGIWFWVLGLGYSPRALSGGGKRCS